MLVGFLLMASPPTVLLGVVPLFETLADIGAHAGIAARPAIDIDRHRRGLITHRPLIGGALIVAGLGLAYLLRRLHRARQPQPPTRFLPTSP